MKRLNKQMNEESLRVGFNQLGKLSSEEYGKNLQAILISPSFDQNQKVLRIGRLMGILVKQSISDPHSIDPSQSKLGAHRAWELKSETFSKKQATATWQYKVLDILRKEEGFESVQMFAERAHHETGFFLPHALLTQICLQ